MTPFSLWRRGNGLYYLTVQLPDGKKQYRSLGTKDKQEAIARSQSFLHPPSHSIPTTPCLSDFLKNFGTYHSGIKSSTLGRYLTSCHSFLRIVGDKGLSTYTSMDIEHFKTVRSQEVNRVSTNIDLRSIKTAFSRARKLKLIPANPFEGVALFKIPKTVPVYLTLEDGRKLLDATHNQMLKAVYLTALSTGCRLNEIATLKWSQVDLNRKVISLTVTKTGGTRVLPISANLFECLGNLPNRSEWVFSNDSRMIGSFSRGRSLATATYSCGEACIVT